MIEERLDRTRLVQASFEEAEAQDVATERIEGVEYLRRWLYGDDQVDARLQRVLCSG